MVNSASFLESKQFPLMELEQRELHRSKFHAILFSNLFDAGRTERQPSA